jgi:triacylglycerol lipase
VRDSTPLVLVHGLWDSPRLFDPLVARLRPTRPRLLVPHLPHRLGVTPIRRLAADLDRALQPFCGREQPIDLLGFSMGGVIARVWLQELGGAARTRRFLSVGSPQQGTLTAQWLPRWPFRGLADMKMGSPLLRELNRDPAALAGVRCESYYCPWDLMVAPGWRAVLPCGSRHRLAVPMHHQLIRSRLALEVIGAALSPGQAGRPSPE